MAPLFEVQGDEQQERGSDVLWRDRMDPLARWRVALTIVFLFPAIEPSTFLWVSFPGRDHGPWSVGRSPVPLPGHHAFLRAGSTVGHSGGSHFPGPLSTYPVNPSSGVQIERSKRRNPWTSGLRLPPVPSGAAGPQPRIVLTRRRGVTQPVSWSPFGGVRIIPKLLHQVWIGPWPAPLSWTETWREMNPGLMYQLWDEEGIEAFGLRNSEVYRRFMGAGLYDGAADVARAEILHRHGGVYADADSVALRPLTGAPFMQAGFFAQHEPSELRADLITNAFMGAVPEHPVLTHYVEVLSQVQTLRPMWRVSGPRRLDGRARRAHGPGRDDPPRVDILHGLAHRSCGAWRRVLRAALLVNDC